MCISSRFAEIRIKVINFSPSKIGINSEEYLCELNRLEEYRQLLLIEDKPLDDETQKEILEFIEFLEKKYE